MGYYNGNKPSYQEEVVYQAYFISWNIHNRLKILLLLLVVVRISKCWCFPFTAPSAETHEKSESYVILLKILTFVNILLLC